MTRQEQIKEAAFEYANKSIQDKGIAYLEFIEVAEWADRTLIEKTCEWLESIAEYIGHDSETLKKSFKNYINEGD